MLLPTETVGATFSYELVFGGIASCWSQQGMAPHFTPRQGAEAIVAMGSLRLILPRDPPRRRRDGVRGGTSPSPLATYGDKVASLATFLKQRVQSKRGKGRPAAAWSWDPRTKEAGWDF